MSPRATRMTMFWATPRRMMFRVEHLNSLSLNGPSLKGLMDLAPLVWLRGFRST